MEPIEMKQERQNAFLAPPTQVPIDGLHVDSRLTLVHSRNLKLDIGMIHRNWLENGRQEVTIEHLELIQFMVNLYIDRCQNGMEDSLTKLEEHSINVWINSMKYKDPGLFNATFEMVFPLTVTKHSYYGLLYSGYSFKMRLKYTRRPKRIHQERYIGVGYKDKGNHSSPHLDGSPSWGDITSYERYYIDALKSAMLYHSKKDVARDQSNSFDLVIKSKKNGDHNLCTERRKYFFRTVKDINDKITGYLLVKKEPVSRVRTIEVRDYSLIYQRISKPVKIGLDCLIIESRVH